MIRKLLLFVFFIPFTVFSQNVKVDSVAVLVLDRMSDVIGELGSCSFNLITSVDQKGLYGLEKKFSNYEVYFKGPSKMLVQARSDDFHKGYWYNGEHMVYYSYKENNYSVINAPDSTLVMIDRIHEDYEIEFPASDFFYPAITDDILENFPTVAFLGNKNINGQNCFHILADNDKMTFQVWISDDALTLPIKFSITYKDREAKPQYLAAFSDWKLNPDLPDVLFEFIPPPGSHQITILSKNEQ